MTALDVRRLAAIDMWGSAGAIRRRRLIRAEFVIGALGCTALGVLALVSASNLGPADCGPVRAAIRDV